MQRRYAIIVTAFLVLCIIAVPGARADVPAQSGCTDQTATTIHQFFNGDHIGQWMDYQSGSVQITFKFWSGANLTGSLVHTRVLDPSDNFIVEFNSGSFEYYTLSSTAGWRVCSTPPAPTPSNTPTNTLTPSITLTPSNTATSTATITPTMVIIVTPTSTLTPVVTLEDVVYYQQQQWLTTVYVLGVVAVLLSLIFLRTRFR